MFSLISDDQQICKVADFYNGKTVFVTGATGFIGSILLETLLRCFPGIETIYILLRPKKNLTPEVRKTTIFSKKIFEIIKEMNPELLEKVHVISGEISLPNLGMNENDVQLLVNEVSVVFHCAAIINFAKPLNFILMHNALSVSTIIELCRKMKKFQCLVFTSTLYSNCNYLNLTLKEEIYRLPFSAQKFLEALKNEDDEELQKIYAYCQPKWPNTYAFSKCLAENVIMDTASDLPVVIIRPSIVISTWKRPIPGYVEGFTGIIALTVGAGKGFIKVLYADPNVKLNLVPVDVVANAHILAAWSIGIKRFTSPLVIHCSASENLYIKLSEYAESMSELSAKYSLPQAFEEFSKLVIVPYKCLYYVVAAYKHYLPAIVLDGMLKVLGKKPRLYSLYRFYDKVMKHLNFFLFETFEIERNNLENLDRLIHPEEREDLFLDFKELIFKEEAIKLPHTSPFYDWKIDKKSPSERQKVIHRRHILINCIKGTFVVISCLLIYWVFSFIL